MSDMVLEEARVDRNLPVNYDEQLAAEALALQKRLAAPSGDNIRTNKDKTFTLPDGTIAPHLEIIVVEFTNVNQYYEGKYDPKDIKPPVCMAIGDVIKEMKPFDKVPDKQNKECDTCPWNQWGSDGKGKACKNQRFLAVIAPDMQKDGPLYTLKVSPTATRFWDAYVSKVTALAGGIIKVVTKVTFDPASEYASLRFETLGVNENWKTAFGRRMAARTRLHAEPDFAPPEAKEEKTTGSKKPAARK